MKRRRQSLTYLVNAIVIALVGAESQLHVIKAKLGVDLFIWISFSLPIVNMILREITGTAVSAIGRRRAVAANPPREPENAPEYFQRGGGV